MNFVLLLLLLLCYSSKWTIQSTGKRVLETLSTL